MNSKNVKKYGRMLSALCAVLSFFTVFFPAIRWNGKKYLAFQIILGYSENDVNIFSASLLSVLPYFLTLFAVATAFYPVLTEYDKKAVIGTAVCAVLSGVLRLFIKATVTLGTFYAPIFEASGETFFSDPSVYLASGTVWGAVLSFLTAVFALLSLLDFDRLKEKPFPKRKEFATEEETERENENGSR